MGKNKEGIMALGAWRCAALIVTALGVAAPAAAQDRAGVFDHYLLALSWSPAWCAEAPDRRDAEQCRRGMGFLVHGLWPQRRDGWPEFCRTDRRDPSRRETAAMADIMGSGGLAWHAWRKHGRCAGLDPADYFAATRRAFESLDLPDDLAALDRTIRIDPQVIEDAFLENNPALSDDAMITRCRDGVFTEIRFCFDRSLRAMDCPGAAPGDCRARAVALPAATP
jgi:ribonuclease T2